MDRAPQTYEPTYETHSEVVETTAVVNVAFVKSMGGILKICEVVLSCIVLICVASASGWSYVSSGGWVNFVAAITLVFAALFYIFYLFNVIRRLRGPWVIIEFCTLIISTFFWFIAFIVAASMHYIAGGAIAAAIFSAVAMALYIAELVTRFRVSRQPGGLRITMTGVTATTTTAYPHVAPSTVPTIHTQPPNSAEPRLGFAGGYPGEHGDEGYVMAS